MSTQPEANSNTKMRDQILNEIRSGRRLEKIVSSIENFLNHQVEKLEQAMAEVDRAAENDRIVKDILRRHEDEKRLWEEERQTETIRLSQAGDELIKAWDKLEEDRRNWVESRN
ncbi:MAG: hypothetical protein AAFN77_07695 [Planctomycetota bacterium]